jgi:PGF-pre-PGF domain-containing protein
MKVKLVSILILFSSLIVAASAAPDEPHRVFGKITDNSSNPVQVEGSFQYQGSEIKAFETDSSGNYDVYIPDQGYEENLDVIVEGSSKGTLAFEPLGVTEKNFNYVSKDDENSSNDGSEDSNSGGGGFSGGIPVSEPENTTDNKTDIIEEENGTNETENLTETNSSENNSVNIKKSIENVTKGSQVNIQINEGAESDQDSSEVSRGDIGSSEDSGFSISSISFTSNTDKESSNFSVTESKNMTEKIREQVKEKPEGDVQSYVEVETDIEAVNATFQFKLPKKAVDKSNATPSQVVQQRYNGTEWQELETEYLNQTNNSYKFQAVSPEGFSVFATTIKNQSITETSEEPSESNKNFLILLIAIIAVITSILYKKRELVLDFLEKRRN